MNRRVGCINTTAHAGGNGRGISKENTGTASIRVAVFSSSARPDGTTATEYTNMTDGSPVIDRVIFQWA